MIRITGGKVYDPANGIDGVVQDICIAEGRIVAQVDGGRTIDASGTLVFPGGVDVHTHVAGGALNFARGLVPENQRVARKFMHGAKLRAGIGGMTPTTFATGYLYAGMGWTTVNEAAVPILSAKHTHEELHDIPIVDKSTLLLMANNEFVLDLLEVGEVERAKHVVGWLIWAAKAYGVKAVNPGGVAAWKWGKNASTLHDPIEGYHSITAAQIISGLAGIIDDLGLPHPLHLHCNNLGVPGNVCHHARNHEGPGRPPCAHGAPPVPRVRRTGLGHDALRSGRDRRGLQCADEPDLPTRARSSSATPSRSPPTVRGSTCFMS